MKSLGGEGRENNDGGKVFVNDETMRYFETEAEHIRLAADEYFQCDALFLVFNVIKVTSVNVMNSAF